MSWPGILAGGFAGLAVLMLLSSFWVAIAGEWTFASDNFRWFQMGSAFVAWLVAGFVTGWYASRSTTAADAVHGATHGFIVWSVLVVARTVIAIPSALAPIGFALSTSSGDPAWASFGAILGGLLTAMVGGALGGTARSATRREQEGRVGTVDVTEDSMTEDSVELREAQPIPAPPTTIGNDVRV